MADETKNANNASNESLNSKTTHSGGVTSTDLLGRFIPIKFKRFLFHNEPMTSFKYEFPLFIFILAIISGAIAAILSVSLLQPLLK